MLSLEARVGFVATAYIADEGDDTVLVCVEVKASECVVNFAFNIEFMTTGGTAGMYYTFM